MKKINMSGNFAFIAIAVVMGVLASFIAIRYVQRQVEVRTGDHRRMVDVAVPKADLPQGTVISVDDLAIRSVDAEMVPADAVTPGNHDEYMGRILRSPVRGGVPLSASALVPLYDQFSAIIPAGKIAYNLSVDENNSISGMVAPGDLIDILFIKDADSSTSARKLAGMQSYPLLDQIKVLATGSRVGEHATRSGQGDYGTEAYSTLTLELDHDQASMLTIATRTGSLRVLLRQISDRTTRVGNVLTENELLQKLRNEAPKKVATAGSASARVEFIIGGR
jgi:pilus assembly protein CpaB